MKAGDRLVEGSLCLNDVIVVARTVGIERDTETKVGVSDSGKLLGIFGPGKCAPVGENVYLGAG